MNGISDTSATDSDSSDLGDILGGYGYSTGYATGQGLVQGAVEQASGSLADWLSNVQPYLLYGVVGLAFLLIISRR